MSSGLFIKTKELSEMGDQLVETIGKSGDTCFITEEGRAKAVLLDIQHYNALMDLVEEAEAAPEPAMASPEINAVSVRHIIDTHSQRIKNTR